MTLTHFCTWLSNDWDVVSIHNPAKKIIGIGESTNGGFVGVLERGLHFSLANDLEKLDATLKFGSKFSKWRGQGWVNPLLDGNIAIHFNNFRLKDLCYERLPEIWPEKFKIMEGDVKSLMSHSNGVTVNIDGTDHEFDYIVDCMGFPMDYSGYTISDCSPVNRCLIHSVTDFDYEPYTDHIATEHGWMFGVPLKSRKTYGYMYNDKITPKEEASASMRKLLEAEVLETKEAEEKEYKFKCYYSNHMISGRIARNGNKALFFEPLVANSIFLYIFAARLFYDFIVNNVPADECNRQFVQAVNEMEDVITYYYQGGSTFDSEFWQTAQKEARARLKRRAPFSEMMNLYKDFKSRGILHHARTYGWAPLTWELIDKEMGYNYIS
ncbi:MAG: tryptophan 7-halogenase [Candidatus Eremiobacteraeota bacterium]|nr:tryptophan 7-halogenase [Candidatus Eremiobacteraeota bacterium]